MNNVLLAFRDNQRDLEILQQIRDEEGWGNWLPIAELSLLELPEFAEFISKELTTCELAVVQLMKLKLSGKSYFEELEEAINIARNPESRDLIIEGLSLARTQKEEFTSILNSNNEDIEALFSALRNFSEAS